MSPSACDVAVRMNLIVGVHRVQGVNLVVGHESRRSPRLNFIDATCACVSKEFAAVHAL